MFIHQTASLALAFVLVTPVALAQTKTKEATADGIKADAKGTAKKVDANSATGTPAADSNASRMDLSMPASGTPSTNDPNRTTDSTKQVAPQTTTIAGQKFVNKDEDLDVSVGKTETTSAGQPGTRDVVESRAEARREGEGRRITVAPLVGYSGADLGVGLGAMPLH